MTVAAAALQYPRRYSTRGAIVPAGTVHEMAARVWGSPGSLREAERYDCSCLILSLLFRDTYILLQTN